MSPAPWLLIAALTSVPAAEPDLADVVARLASPDPAERAAASKSLESAGRAALPALRRAHDSPDPELRGRAAALWESIQRGLLARPTLVLLGYRDQPLADVIADLRGQTGLPLRAGQTGARKLLSARDPVPVPFWEAVERLGLKGARFTNHNPHGVGFPELELTEEPEATFTSHSGPFRVALTGLHLHRDRRLIRGPWVEIDRMGQRVGVPRGDSAGAAVTFTGGLDVMVEPRAWFTQEAPARLTEATDELGQSLVPEPGEPQGRADYLFFAGSGVTHVTTDFRLRTPDRPGRVARLRGVVPVLLHLRRPDPALVIPLAGAAGKTFRCDDAEFTIGAVNDSPTGTSVTLTARLNVDRADLPDHPDPQLVGTRLHVMGFHQLELTDAGGAVLVDSIGSGGGGGDTPAVCRWTIGTFDKGPATHLRYFGMIRVPSEAAFDFREVPLP